jgi:tetratricopeptide (TPR) repeat protein
VEPTDKAVDLLNQAWRLRDAAQLRAAQECCVRAAEIFEREDGPESADLANTLNLLASISVDRGEYEGAVTAAARSASICAGWAGGFSGDDATRIAMQSWTALGTAYRCQGRYAFAEPELKRALQTAIGHFGRCHAESRMARNNLAVLYKYTGQFERAEALYLAAMQGAEGEELATVYHNLGGLEHARGRFAVGEPWARKAWELRKALLGTEAPAALADEAALAGVLDGLDRYDESEPMYHHVLGAFERIYGLHHYEIAVNLHNLAGVQCARGRLEEAECTYRRAMVLKETLLGPDHPDTALTAHNLGILMMDSGRNDEAAALLERASGVFKTALGSDHPHTKAAAVGQAACAGRGSGVGARRLSSSMRSPGSE